MSLAKRITKNVISLTILEIASKLLSFVLVIFLARYLGDAKFGQYNFILSFIMLAGILTDLGLTTLAIRDLSRDISQARKNLGNITLLKIFLSTVSIISAIVVINLMHYPDEIRLAVYLMTPTLLFNSISPTYIYRAFKKMETEAIVGITINALTAGLTLGALFLGYGLISVILIALIGSAIGFVLNWLVVLKKFIKPIFEINFVVLKNTLRKALPFGLTAVFVMLYVKIDTIMLSVMKGDAVVGWYGAAYSLVLALNFIPGVFIHSIFPEFSELFVKSKEKMIHLYKLVYKCLFIIGLPITIGIILLADKFILLFYDSGYANSIMALQILSGIIAIGFLNWLSGTALNSINKQKLFAAVVGFGAVFNILLNLLLIPKYSLIGAGIATVLTELLVFISMHYFASKYVYKINLLRVMAKPILAGAIMGIFIFYFRNINLLLLIISSIIIYFGILFAIKGIKKEEINLIKK